MGATLRYFSDHREVPGRFLDAGLVPILDPDWPPVPAAYVKAKDR
jgi:hypothetical protein